MRHSLVARVGALALVAGLFLGCQTTRDAPKTTVGGLGGAVAGGLLGAALGGKTTGILAGAAIGGLLGGAVGNVLDQRDRDLAARTAQTSLETAPTGTASTWNNPDTGASGTFTPTRTYQEGSGRYCREYQQEIYVGGERHRGYGTACRMADGTWQIQN